METSECFRETFGRCVLIFHSDVDHSTVGAQQIPTGQTQPTIANILPNGDSGHQMEQALKMSAGCKRLRCDILHAELVQQMLFHIANRLIDAEQPFHTVTPFSIVLYRLSSDLSCQKMRSVVWHDKMVRPRRIVARRRHASCGGTGAPLISSWTALPSACADFVYHPGGIGQFGAQHFFAGPTAKPATGAPRESRARNGG